MAIDALNCSNSNYTVQHILYNIFILITMIQQKIFFHDLKTTFFILKFLATHGSLIHRKKKKQICHVILRLWDLPVGTHNESDSALFMIALKYYFHLHSQTRIIYIREENISLLFIIEKNTILWINSSTDHCKSIYLILLDITQANNCWGITILSYIDLIQQRFCVRRAWIVISTVYNSLNERECVLWPHGFILDDRGDYSIIVFYVIPCNIPVVVSCVVSAPFLPPTPQLILDTSKAGSLAGASNRR